MGVVFSEPPSCQAQIDPSSPTAAVSSSPVWILHSFLLLLSSRCGETSSITGAGTSPSLTGSVSVSRAVVSSTPVSHYCSLSVFPPRSLASSSDEYNKWRHILLRMPKQPQELLLKLPVYTGRKASQHNGHYKSCPVIGTMRS